jgi:acyl-CoA thioesterase-1
MLTRALAAILAAFLLASASAQTPAPKPGEPPPALHIVVVGASNTHGFYLKKNEAYPALLEGLLRAKGVAAQVKNAGVPFETTGKMRKRLDRDVPEGTDLVILHPGQNDRFLFQPPRRRAANIAAMVKGLRRRSIRVLVYEDEVARRYYGFDAIHLTREGHAVVAKSLLPRVIAALAAPAPAGD